MRSDDPIIHLADAEWRQEFLSFIDTAVPAAGFDLLINTNVAYQYGVSIRASFEESILFELHHQRRVAAFLTTLEYQIRPDVRHYLETDAWPPPLQEFFGSHRAAARSTKNFRDFEARRRQQWNAETGAIIDGSPTQAMMHIRRFQRLRRLWALETEVPDDLLSALVPARRRPDFQAFVNTAIADADFAQFINKDLACQRAIRFRAHYEENILFVASFYRRLKTIASQLEPRWRQEFLAYFAVGDISQEFREFHADYPELERMLAEFQQNEGEQAHRHAIQEQALAADHSTDQAATLTKRMSTLRQMWLNEELNL